MAEIHFQDADIRITVERASGLLAKAMGLAFRSAPRSSGMLFPFKRQARPRLWMWGMRFPLDIIWMAAGRVVQCDVQCMPPRFPILSAVVPVGLRFYRCGSAVDAVVEVPAGFCARYGIGAGERVCYEME